MNTEGLGTLHPAPFVITARRTDCRMSLLHAFGLTYFFGLHEVTWSAFSVSEACWEDCWERLWLSSARRTIDITYLSCVIKLAYDPNINRSNLRGRRL